MTDRWKEGGKAEVLIHGTIFKGEILEHSESGVAIRLDNGAIVANTWRNAEGKRVFSGCLIWRPE